jgi:hypothetical protein
MPKKSAKKPRKTKSKKDGVVIHNENKVIIHHPKPKKRTYRRKPMAQSSIPQTQYPVINYFNQEPKKESQSQLNEMAQNYISPPLLLRGSPENEEQSQSMNELIKNEIVRPLRVKSITEQIHRKPNLKIVDIENPRQLKELGRRNGLSEDVLKGINTKNKNEMIEKYSTQFKEVQNAGGNNVPAQSKPQPGFMNELHQTAQQLEETNQNPDEDTLQSVIEQNEPKKVIIKPKSKAKAGGSEV